MKVETPEKEKHVVKKKVRPMILVHLEPFFL